MKQSIVEKLEKLSERYEEIAALLATSEIINQADKLRELSTEYSELEPVVKAFADYNSLLEDMNYAEQMLKDSDADIRDMAQSELQSAKSKISEVKHDLQVLLLPKDPNDKNNVFLEIRAGTGGDEASLFVKDLFRMYERYAELQNWKIEVISCSEAEQGGYKELIAKIIGQGVYSKLKFESGAHRVQRVPATESQGRIHTSACTVAVMPESDEIEDVEIDNGDLRIDTYRASGSGGQHVNRTDSAVRITHIPTGVVVECQQERSQHKNKAKAMALLKSRILTDQQNKLQAEVAATRKNLVGSGDRSERIRTYNYPQGRVTDHRINLTLYKLNEILEGELNLVIEPIINEHQTDLLASLGEQN